MDINKNQNLKIGWNFDNSYIHLPEKLYSKEKPSPVSSPKLLILNESLAQSLGLDSNALRSDIGIEILAGNRVPKATISIAQAYAGHQFGHFTMLGDGRAILLGEHISPQGERFDIQLKGSGRTAYSRGGDGRAAVGPMLREYIISQALNGLDIPSTRSLAVVLTGEAIHRQRALPGAILTRVASSHIRVGTFQYIAVYGSNDQLRQLAEYTLQRHFPSVASDENRYLLLLKEVISRQAKLIAKWQLVGFIHGVMNTDNMAISGESIDFGPCAFMDSYDPRTVFSSIDVKGRYAYRNQPEIAAWNLARFAETLLPLLHSNEDRAVEMANQEIENFYNIYEDQWLNGMRRKLGIFDERSQDKAIITELLDIMHKYKADFTNTFRGLTMDQLCGMDLFDAGEFKKWYNKWQARIDNQEESREESKQLMKNNNPAIIPRNHRVEQVLEVAEREGAYDPMKEFLDVLANPYLYSEEQKEYAKLPPKSASPYRTFCGT